MSDEYEAAILALFLRYKKPDRRHETFTRKLLGVIGASGSEDRDRLRRGFPQTVRAWEDWSRATNQKAFFDSKGFTEEP